MSKDSKNDTISTDLADSAVSVLRMIATLRSAWSNAPWIPARVLPPVKQDGYSTLLKLRDERLVLARWTPEGWECACGYCAIAADEIVGWLPGPKWVLGLSWDTSADEPAAESHE